MKKESSAKWRKQISGKRKKGSKCWQYSQYMGDEKEIVNLDTIYSMDYKKMVVNIDTIYRMGDEKKVRN